MHQKILSSVKLYRKPRTTRKSSMWLPSFHSSNLHTSTKLHYYASCNAPTSWMAQLYEADTSNTWEPYCSCEASAYDHCKPNTCAICLHEDSILQPITLELLEASSVPESLNSKLCSKGLARTGLTNNYRTEEPHDFLVKHGIGSHSLVASPKHVPFT